MKRFNMSLKGIVFRSFIVVFLVFVSCEEENPVAIDRNKDKGFPSRVLRNAEIVQLDSGFVKVKLKVPLLEEYEFADIPFVEIRNGLYLEFYNSRKLKTPGILTAKYAKFIEKKGFYMAKGDVNVTNSEGKTFIMQSVYWDKENRKMYTEDTVFISDKEGNTFVAANGMTAKDDFSEYTFYNSSGNIKQREVLDIR